MAESNNGTALNVQKISAREEKALLENLRCQLSTPIDSIIGYSEILLDEIQEYPDEVLNSSDVINKILDSGKQLQKEFDRTLEVETFSKKDFDFTTFSNELRMTLLTILNSIIGFSELLLEEPSLRQYRLLIDDIQQIHTAAKNFLIYINEIILISDVKTQTADLMTKFSGSVQLINDTISKIPMLKKKEQGVAADINGTILIVDDNSMSRVLMVRRLNHFGFTTLEAKNGEECFQLLQSENCDLILLNIVMHGMSGFDILSRLKSETATVGKPVIMISTFKEIDCAVRCIEAGADDYLEKPFNQVLLFSKIVALVNKKGLIDKQNELYISLAQEEERAQKLLLNILPETIADDLKLGKSVKLKRMMHASILFADIVNFTRITTQLSLDELSDFLNRVFSIFDMLVDKYGVEKIKTIGDNYMIAAGLPLPDKQHAEKLVQIGLDFLEDLKQFEVKPLPKISKIQVRIGISSGEVIAGIIGKKKFIYDVWGSPVNLASRMESEGVPNRIQISKQTHALVKDKFTFERNIVNIKGMGKMQVYLVRGYR